MLTVPSNGDQSAITSASAATDSIGRAMIAIPTMTDSDPRTIRAHFVSWYRPLISSPIMVAPFKMKWGREGTDGADVRTALSYDGISRDPLCRRAHGLPAEPVVEADLAEAGVVGHERAFVQHRAEVGRARICDH